MSPPLYERNGGGAVGGGDRLAAFQVKYCRMCALELRQGVLIFGNEGQRLRLPDKIRKTVSILVLEEDSLPKKICTECCSSLEDYSKYKDTVLDAQEKLTSIVRNLERSIEASASVFVPDNHSSTRRNAVIPERQRHQTKAQVEVSEEPSLSPAHSPAIICSVDEGDNLSSPHSVHSVEDSPSVIPQVEEEEYVELQEGSISEAKTQTKGCTAKKSADEEGSHASVTKLSGYDLPVKVCESSKSYQLIIPSPTKNIPSTSSANLVAFVRTKDKQKDVEESGFDMKCGLCGILPQDKKGLEAHHSSEHDLLKYPSPVYGCPECPRITENFNAMRIHLYRHKQDDRFKCKECEKSYAFENQLQGHVLAAHNPNGKAFSCKICGKRFSAKCTLVAHMTSKHPVSSEEKQVLEVETTDGSGSESTTAANVHRKEEPSSSKCTRFASMESECKNTLEDIDVDPDVNSGSMSDAEQPQQSETSQELKTKTECVIVGSDTVNSAGTGTSLSPSKINEISTTHTEVSTKKEGKCEKDDGMWKCEYCDKILQSESGYRNHMKKHRGKRFHCDHCQAVFTQAGSLKHHVMTKHPGILPIEKEAHSCPTCAKSFATKKRLRDHQRLHKQPETALQCSVCKKSYRSAEHLRFHMRYHQSSDHKCSTCEKSFRNAKQLQCHENTHTGSKPFKCLKCSTEFGNSGSYYKHVKKCNGSPSETVSKSKSKLKGKEVTKPSKPTSSTQIPPQPSDPGNIAFGPSQTDPPLSHLPAETVTVNIHESNASHSSVSSNILPNVPVTSQSILQSEHNQSSVYLNQGSANTVEPSHVSHPQSNSSPTTSSVSVANYSSHQQFQTPHHQQAHPSSSVNHYQQTPWQTSSGNLTQGQLTGTSKPFSSSQQVSHSHTGSLGNMDLVDCEIHHTLGSENLSVHNLSYSHHAHVYSPNHHPSSSNQHTSSHGQNVSPQSVNSSNPSLPVSTAHSTNAAISSTSSSLIITSSHPSHQSHHANINNPRCHQSEPMELSYKLQLESSEFQDMPMELTKVFQRDPLELCVRQDFNPLMDLSSRVQDGNGMHMSSMNMSNGMNTGGGSGNSSLIGISMYHNKLDMVDRDMSFSDLSGAFRQPIDLIARPEDSHNLCSEGNLVDLSLRSAAFGQDQSTSTFLRELIDLSARSDSFHGELNLTNKQHHQQQNHVSTHHQNHHNLHHHGTGNHTNASATPMSKSSSGGNGQSHHGNGTNSFQNLYHDSIFSMQN